MKDTGRGVAQGTRDERMATRLAARVSVPQMPSERGEPGRRRREGNLVLFFIYSAGWLANTGRNELRSRDISLVNKSGAIRLKSHIWHGDGSRTTDAFVFGWATLRRLADEEGRQSIREVFLERNRSAFSLPSPPQGSPKPCRQDADPHTET